MVEVFNWNMTTQVGDLVWRNKDPALEAQARASYETLSSAEMRKVPVGAKVSGSIGQVSLVSVRMHPRRGKRFQLAQLMRQEQRPSIRL